MGGQNGVVWLDDRGGGLGSRVDAELQLALLAIVDGEALHQQGTETRASAAAEGVEDQEALEAGAAVGDTADLVQDAIDKLLANGVVTTGIVVGGILLAGNHVLGMEETSVSAGSDLVDYIGLKIAVDCARDVLSLACVVQGTRSQINSSTKGLARGARTSLGEEGAEAMVGVSGLALVGQVAIGLQRVTRQWRPAQRELQIEDDVPECRVQDSRARDEGGRVSMRLGGVLAGGPTRARGWLCARDGGVVC